MRVRTIETFKVPPRWLFVRIETESGLVGWGEPIVEGRADTVAAAVRDGRIRCWQGRRSHRGHLPGAYRGPFTGEAPY